MCIYIYIIQVHKSISLPINDYMYMYILLFVYIYIYLQPKGPAFIEVFQNNQVLETISLKFRQGAETTKGAENEASRG